jgi:hypothetical protein
MSKGSGVTFSTTSHSFSMDSAIFLIFFSFLVSEDDKLLWNSWKFIGSSGDDADDDRTEINPAKRAKTNKKK